MAASVENCRFPHCEPAMKGVVHFFNLRPNHRSDSPVCGRNIPTTFPVKHVAMNDSSSEEDDEKTPSNLNTRVGTELANAESWWYKPEYIINEWNTNSVITTPCHEEILPINSWTTQRPYTLRGYSWTTCGLLLDYCGCD